MHKGINTTCDEGQTLIPTTGGGFDVAHSPRAEGFDAGEDGTGRGTPLVPVAYGISNQPTPKFGVDVCPSRDSKSSGGGGMEAVAFDTTQITSAANYSNPKPGDPCHPLAAGAHPPAIAIPINADALRGEGSAKTPSPDAEGRVRLRDPGLGVGLDGDPAGTLSAAGPGAVAFSAKDYGADAGEVAPTLRGMGHAAGAHPPAIAFQLNGDRDAPGVSVSEEASFTIPANPMSDRGQAVAFNARQDPDSWSEHTGPLDTDGATQAVAFQTSQSGVRCSDTHATLDSNNGSRRHHGAVVGMQVRRLTPRECERLQGFPDDYTLIPYRNKPAADGLRYKALGNSMCTNVMRWIAEHLEAALVVGRLF